MMEALFANTLLSFVIHRKIVSQNSEQAAADTITVFLVSTSKGFKHIRKTNLPTLYTEPILTTFQICILTPRAQNKVAL